MERYLEEKANGFETPEAIVTAMTKVGRAISASGLKKLDCHNPQYHFTYLCCKTPD